MKIEHLIGQYCIAFVAYELMFVLSYCVIIDKESMNFEKFDLLESCGLNSMNYR